MHSVVIITVRIQDRDDVDGERVLWLMSGWIKVCVHVFILVSV